jgi:hypothetical protein
LLSEKSFSDDLLLKCFEDFPDRFLFKLPLDFGRLANINSSSNFARVSCSYLNVFGFYLQICRGIDENRV